MVLLFQQFQKFQKDAKVPDVMFNVFGGGSSSEYTWYSIGALLFVQLVGIVGSQAGMTIAGSAKNEYAARIGAVTGGFSKRFVTIAWAFCGLIAIALFGPNLSDPDQTWGLLTRALLPVGLIGRHRADRVVRGHVLPQRDQLARHAVPRQRGRSPDDQLPV